MALESAMRVGKGNKYKLVHMGKDQRRRKDRLPVTLVRNQDAILKARELIQITV